MVSAKFHHVVRARKLKIWPNFDHLRAPIPTPFSDHGEIWHTTVNLLSMWQRREHGFTGREHGFTGREHGRCSRVVNTGSRVVNTGSVFRAPGCTGHLLTTSEHGPGHIRCCDQEWAVQKQLNLLRNTSCSPSAAERFWKWYAKLGGPETEASPVGSRGKASAGDLGSGAPEA